MELCNTLEPVHHGIFSHWDIPEGARRQDLFPFLNRKQYHSITVQIICDAHNHLLNVVSRFPGGAHESYILQNSSVGVHLVQ
ncbi:hypothetical protein CRUP_024827 [Coryphaenoides rupestris]|nr:hypothetical protein CRUP_024827 [Coryphaenoides rupestris]